MDPSLSGKAIWRSTFPPHARGWTRDHVVLRRELYVSPACAGMDPSRALHPNG